MQNQYNQQGNQGNQGYDMYQQPPMDMVTSNYPAYMDRQHAELVKLIIDPSDIIEQVENKLRGMTFKKFIDKENGDEKYDWVQVREPSMNDRGISEITATLDMMFSRSNALSNITDQEANKISRDFAHVIRKLVYSNYDKFGVKQSSMEWIVMTIFWIIYMHLKKSVDAQYLDFLKGTTRYIEQYTEGGMGKKRGGGFGEMLKKLSPF